MRSIRDLLAEQPFFADLEPGDLDLLSGCGTNVHYRSGDRVMSEGQPADNFLLLREGRVAFEINVPEREPLVIDTAGPGDLVGVSWLFAPYRWSFDVTALEDVRAVSLDAVCLRQKCDDDTRLGYQLMSRFALLLRDRLQATRLQLIDMYGSQRAG